MRAFRSGRTWRESKRPATPDVYIDQAALSGQEGHRTNTDYAIHITTRRGRTWSYIKEDKDWTQTAPTGRVRRLSAEQLLSHLLPPLAGDQPGLSVGVERLKAKEKTTETSASTKKRKTKAKKWKTALHGR